MKLKSTVIAIGLALGIPLLLAGGAFARGGGSAGGGGHHGGGGSAAGAHAGAFSRQPRAFNRIAGSGGARHSRHGRHFRHGLGVYDFGDYPYAYDCDPYFEYLCNVY